MKLTIAFVLPALAFSQNCTYGDDIHDQDMDLCYNFPPELLSWGNAREACQNLNYRLVSIHNLKQNDFLAERSRTVFCQKSTDSCRFWTGLGRSDHILEFQWTDGTVIDYWNWLEGEPVFDCMLFNMNTTQWETYEQDETFHFVCAGQPVRPSTATKTTPSNSISTTTIESTTKSTCSLNVLRMVCVMLLISMCLL